MQVSREADQISLSLKAKPTDYSMVKGLTRQGDVGQLKDLGKEPGANTGDEGDDQDPDDRYTVFVDEAHGSIV